jgi:uracil-DNA glycosylase family 4
MLEGQMGKHRTALGAALEELPTIQGLKNYSQLPSYSFGSGNFLRNGTLNERRVSMGWYIELDYCNNLGELENIAQGCKKCSLCKCSLYEGAKQVVFGKGSHDAPVMLVGEAPGVDEDEQGIPFVGRAGQLLDKILLSAGIDNVYITNAVKCRPPGNRLPKKDEVDACRPYLTRQIELIKPRIIVCLGALATQQLIHPQAKITMVHGKVFTKGEIKIVPTFHPAALLRDPNKKKPCWDDFKTIRAIFDSIKEKDAAVG